ncbi:glycosyltransferase [Isoptericola aurantiacus]|uniref:glycosyltransferase n=1 Tax=Isoptericola aurantiacus TaxID=3377839 RepID=UPI00383B5307
MPPTVRSLVVVLSFHGVDDTLACVDSLVQGSPGHDVLVIDNGSFDGVLDELAARFHGVATMQTGTNLGFSGGMNAGISRGLREGYDVVTVLNNDTVVEPGALDELVGIAASGGTAVSPLVLYRDEPGRAWFEGGLLDPDDGLPRHMTPVEAAAAGRRDGGDPYAVAILAGCCVTASASTWRDVGLYDDRYFLNFEDSDWSMRARSRGVTLQVAPRARIHHGVSRSFTGAHAYLGTYYYLRNLLLFASTWLPARQRRRLLRTRVLPTPVRDARAHSARAGIRTGWILATVAVARVQRRYGRAPARLERRARRWSDASRHRSSRIHPL